MFPDYESQINIGEMIETTSNGKSFLFNFSIGDFPLKDGKLQVITGIDALKVWIEKVLRTEKKKFRIYDEYGVSFEVLNTKHPYMFIQAEIQREITEVLSKNSDILSIDNFSFALEKRTLIVSFEVNSVYGLISQEVSF